MQVKDGMFSWTSNVMPRSLTELSRETNRIALHIFKELLGYMGDKQMYTSYTTCFLSIFCFHFLCMNYSIWTTYHISRPFPAILAQDILRKGFDFSGLRDEIYLQIIKQITDNPRIESAAKGWQMMCMCLITFPPSVDFENYLLHFILDKCLNGKVS